MTRSTISHRRYIFAGFTLDTDRGAVQSDGVDIKLRPKSFDLLCYLLERHGCLVSKDEILNEIWGKTVVTDDAVTQCVIDIRRAIGDRSQSMIRTVPRRGYILDIPVTVQDESGVVPGRDISARSNSGNRGLWIATTSTAMLAAALLSWQMVSRTSEAPVNGDPALLVEPLSIAVLPFSDMSQQQDMGYFADGISEELLNVLSQVRELRVISRTSSFAFKGQAVGISTIRERLGVSHVLEGSIRKSEDRIRITAQLIDASNSEHLWSETYDRTLGDIFAVQDEISAQVLKQLTDSLSVSTPKVRATDPQAYSLYLQALHLTDKLSFRENVEAQRLFEQSLEIDQTYAPAWRELGRVLWRQIGNGPSIREDIARTVNALDQASKFAPNDAALLAYRAWHEADFNGLPAKAARLFEDAFSIEPADESVIRTSLQFTLAFGEPEDAVALGEFGIARNPLCHPCYVNLVRAYLLAGQLMEAENASRTMLSLFGRGHFLLGHALLLRGQPQDALAAYSDDRDLRSITLGLYRAMAIYDLGRREEATEIFDSVREDVSVELLWRYAMAYAWMGYNDSAFELIDKAAQRMQLSVDGEIVRLNLIGISMVARDARFQRLHDDPRWDHFLHKYGVSPEHFANLNFSFVPPQ